MKVDGSLRSLIQGVSQQSARNRLPGQCTAQDNMSSNPVTGLTRRPPMQEVSSLFEEADDVQFYDFDLGEGNQFIVAALEGELKVFNMDGDEQVVNDDTEATATVTMTIATPAVVSWTAHGRVAGDFVVFTTTGALPTGLVAGTKYYVSSANLTGNTFKVAATRAAALAGTGSINTSGTQSGTHTATSGFNYLDGGDLAFTTLDDVTYIANRSQVVDMESATKTYITTGSLVYLLGGQYGRVYTINVNWTGKTGTVTITIATPGVVSWASHGLQIGDEVVFTTTGALPTGLVAGTTYYVSTTGFGANSFSVSTTRANALAGTNITTSGTQSGVHTAEGTVITASYTAPDGGSAAHSAQITTDYIATQLETALNAHGTFAANFSVTRSSDVLYIKKTSSVTTEPFKVTIADGDGGENMKVVNNSIKDASTLPRYAPHGYVVTVEGAAADADDWYVEFIAEPDAAGNLPATGAGFGRNGVWAECVGPGVEYQFDLETMPHVLEYDFDAEEFTFSSGAWEDRAAGDESSNKNPTFVGRTVEDLAYFQGRLVMLSGPAVIMSRTDKPYNFWLNSATVLADSDRIDIQSTAKGVRKMLRAIPHNRDLVVFANKGQFIVFGRNAITPKNSALVLTTNFEADMTASPVPAGRNIFFAFKFGNFTGIREFYTQDAQDANDARPITQHVNKYLEGSVESLTATSNFDILLVQTTVGLETIYLYEYTWIDEKKVQSSWSRWIMPNDVIHTFITESEISLITKKDDTYILNKIDLDFLADTGLTYNVRLDRKIFIDTVDETIVAPYDVPEADPDDLIFIQGDGCPTPGLRAWVDSYDAGSDTYTFDRSMENGTVIVGIPYTSSYTPTNPDVKDSDGVRIGTGGLKVSKFLLNCKETGKLFARIFSRFFDDRVIEFTARFVGDPLTHVGEAAITDATYIAPFRENVDNAEIEIYSDSHLPFTLSDIEWKGQYTKKGKRIANGGAQ